LAVLRRYYSFIIDGLRNPPAYYLAPRLDGSDSFMILRGRSGGPFSAISLSSMQIVRNLKKMNFAVAYSPPDPALCPSPSSFRTSPLGRFLLNVGPGFVLLSLLLDMITALFFGPLFQCKLTAALAAAASQQ